MSRTYRTGEARSLPYGKRMVRGPKVDWQGRSTFKPKSAPPRPLFAEPRKDGRNTFFTAMWWRDVFQNRWTAAKVRADREWLSHHGLCRKLRNAANATRIRHKVANRRSRTI